jgi:hypothetical protein
MAVNFVASASYPAFNEFALSQPPIKPVVSYSILPSLSASNNQRQGVELRTSADIYNSSQVKIWAGKIKRDGVIEQGYLETEILGYGQPLSFTATYFQSDFTERQIKFDPVAYVSNSLLYPFPIELNGGLPSQDTNILEPFTIPFRLPNTENNYFAKGIHGTLDEGPESDGLGKGNRIISQFIAYYDVNIESVPFLDEGQQIIGDPSGAVYFPGYVPTNQGQIAGYTEKPNNFDLFIITASADFRSALETLDYSRDEDIRQTFVRKSAAAGYDSYGPGMARIGTDSIAYASRLRGS